MRIYELIDTIPGTADEIFICHAPDGQCRILSREGDLYDLPGQLASAKALVFDSHWRGANAQEIANHWPKPQAATEAPVPRRTYLLDDPDEAGNRG